MSLTDALIEALAEALGIPMEKKPPPKRKAPPSRAAAEAGPQHRSVPASGQPQARRKQERPKRQARDEERPAGDLRATVPADSMLLVEAASRTEPAAPQSELPKPYAPPAAGTSRAIPPGAPSELAARLRRNPVAARDAFIYSEIFGPPVGERRDWK